MSKNNKYKKTKPYVEFWKMMITSVATVISGSLLMYYAPDIGGDWAVIVGLIVVVAAIPFAVTAFIKFGVDYSFMKKEYAVKKYSENVAPNKNNQPAPMPRQQMMNPGMPPQNPQNYQNYNNNNR